MSTNSKSMSRDYWREQSRHTWLHIILNFPSKTNRCWTYSVVTTRHASSGAGRRPSLSPGMFTFTFLPLLFLGLIFQFYPSVVAMDATCCDPGDLHERPATSPCWDDEAGGGEGGGGELRVCKPSCGRRSKYPRHARVRERSHYDWCCVLFARQGMPLAVAARLRSGSIAKLCADLLSIGDKSVPWKT